MAGNKNFNIISPNTAGSPTAADRYFGNNKEKQNLGGRPVKEGLKNMQFTLTMHPKRYEQLRIIAQQNCNGNFSRLIDDAINLYCNEHNINISDIEVSEEILERYMKRQIEKRQKEKQKGVK